MQKIRIINNYSQVSLLPLETAVYHIEMNCQFNIEDLKNYDLIQFQGICPVCNEYGNFQLDERILQGQEYLKNNQLFENLDVLYKSTRSSFSSHCFSQDKIVFELQQIFNQQELIGTKYKELDKEKIEKLSLLRNQEYFNLIKNQQNQEERIPLLYGIINYRLILFYNIKIKLELYLYDSSINTFINYKNSGIIKQVLLHKTYMYFIIEKNKIHQLYRGDFQQCFQQDKTIFIIEKIPNYTMLGETQLFIIYQNLQMIGNFGSMIINDIIDVNVQMTDQPKLRNLKRKPQIAQFKDTLLLAYSQSEYLEKSLYQYYNLYTYQTFEELPAQTTTYNDNFNFSLKHSDCLYLLDCSKLQFQKQQVQFLSNGQYQSFIKTFNIINHHSYLEVIEIPTSQQEIQNICFKLVGLKLYYKQQNEIILPGIIVLNVYTKEIEIELI